MNAIIEFVHVGSSILFWNVGRSSKSVGASRCHAPQKCCQPTATVASENAKTESAKKPVRKSAKKLVRSSCRRCCHTRYGTACASLHLWCYRVIIGQASSQGDRPCGPQGLSIQHLLAERIEMERGVFQRVVVVLAVCRVSTAFLAQAWNWVFAPLPAGRICQLPRAMVQEQRQRVMFDGVRISVMPDERAKCISELMQLRKLKKWTNTTWKEAMRKYGEKLRARRSQPPAATPAPRSIKQLDGSLKEQTTPVVRRIH